MSTETDMQRVQTKAFIDADPADIILSRAELVSNGAGGTRLGAPSSIPSQTVRIIPTGPGTERELVDGQTVQVDYVVMGEYDFDVLRGDWFYKDGIKYEVVSFANTGHYEVKAEVTNRG